MDWIHVTRFRDRWQAVVNTVMNFRIHKMQQISWLVEELFIFSRMAVLQRVGQSCCHNAVRPAPGPVLFSNQPDAVRVFPVSVRADGQSLLQQDTPALASRTVLGLIST